MRTFIVIALVVILTGCDKKSDDAPGAASSVTIAAPGVAVTAGRAPGTESAPGAPAAAGGVTSVQAGRVTVKTGPSGAASVNVGGVHVDTNKGGSTIVVPGVGTIKTP